MREGNTELVSHLHNLVRDHPEFEVLCEPTSHPYCFRYLPNGFAEHQNEPDVQGRVDTLNKEIVHAVEREELTLTRFDGRFAIHVSISSETTSREDVDAMFEAIARWGRLLTMNLTVSDELTPDVEESYV